MKLADFSFVLGGVLLNAAGQLLLKLGASRVGPMVFDGDWQRLLRQGLAAASQWPILGGLAVYALSVVLWVIALSRVDVSVAYPMLSIGYVLSALAATWMFNEPVGLQRWGGIAVILLGVWLVAASSRSAA